MALSVPKASSLLLRRRTRHKKLSYSRTRSTSLPGRFHPVVAGLHESAAALVAWTTDKESSPPAGAAQQPQQEVASTAWIGDGVARLGRVLAGLTDLLHHPQAQDPLQRQHTTTNNSSNKAATPWAERLLDDLLLLADAHACFRDALLSLAQLLAEARAALRRRDAARLATALRARRRSDRDLSRLASTLRCLAHRSSSSSSSTSSSIGADSGEAALAEAVAAATSAAAAASAAIFSGLASASASSSAASRSMTSPMMAVSPAAKVAAVPVWWVADLLRWRRRTVPVAASEAGSEVPLEECCDEEEDERQAAMERLRSLEDCVVAAEDGCEQVYRALVNARVSLLNVMTPCF
ncbi:hypothetical protein PR202_gb18488 [Eleusine coracana subsp. coracana]|uniref:Uncharacterized protein n=1 Tax=Eleusine coracana subsp. coracana TaxID=191504 RepID=A0AAV5F5N8_ELECO|nr:hypothetical protein PR202_gb18488 [Eleusine coracana subsp. coracana]